VWYIYCPEAVRSTRRSPAVTKSFRCQDAGVVCDAVVTGDTEDEVVAKAVDHAREAHGVDIAQSSTLAKYVRAGIRDEERSG
jgi:predicted small metal-binding protein